jgi:hypothetical protein
MMELLLCLLLLDSALLSFFLLFRWDELLGIDAENTHADIAEAREALAAARSELEALRCIDGA